jgi:methylenetetrahydrofolate reductase (NADPH)
MRSRSSSSRASEDERAALKALVAQPLFELIPLRDALEKAEALPQGSAVTVTASPSHGIEATVELAGALQARGHDATPHLSAHMVRDEAHLRDLLDACRGHGLRTGFVVGGDARDRGIFHDGITLLRAIVEVGNPFAEIGVPSYPEGHPDIGDDVLLQALREKQEHAAFMTTQMSFNPGAISAWVTRVRSDGITLPVHLGVPGVAEMTKLMGIASRIGVADSARYLRKNKRLIGHVIRGRFGPDALLERLAPTLADPTADVRALHLFTFNQVESTVEWQREMLEELSEE